jgi:hypothetical protein
VRRERKGCRGTLRSFGVAIPALDVKCNMGTGYKLHKLFGLPSGRPAPRCNQPCRGHRDNWRHLYAAEFEGVPGADQVNSLLADVRYFQRLWRITHDVRREWPDQPGLPSHRAGWRRSPRHGAKRTALGKAGTLSKVNYFFPGWNVESDGTGQKYALDTAITVPANNRLFTILESLLFSVPIHWPPARPAGLTRAGGTLQ